VTFDWGDDPGPPEWIPGRLPSAQGEIAEVLAELNAALDRAGFPAWSPDADRPLPQRHAAPPLW
jgi:hypothetical protein